MKQEVTIGSIVKTSVVTAFTIAAALIWTNVITETINRIVSPGELLLYKFVAAIIATIFVVIAIYIILKTESRAESILKKLKKRGK